MDKKSLQKYVNASNKHLESKNKRLLTVEEEDIVLAHLRKIAAGYSEEESSYDLMTVICMECAKKVCEVHPDMEAISDEIANQRMGEMEKVQKVLNET